VEWLSLVAVVWWAALGLLDREWVVQEIRWRAVAVAVAVVQMGAVAGQRVVRTARHLVCWL
jgi:hypothetical protein